MVKEWLCFVADLISEYRKFQNEFSFMKSSFEHLTRQVMLQQFYVEERTRTDGGSGLKQVIPVT